MNPLTVRFRSRMSALAALCLLHGPLTALTIPVQDGDFTPTDWTHEVRFDAGFDTVNTTVTQVGSGGNPGSYRNIGYAMAWNGSQTYGSVYVLNRFVDSSYDPATQGAINFLNYAEQQTRTGANWSPALVAGNPLIFQDGKVFIGPGFVFGPTDYAWSAYADNSLLATEFQELSGMSLIPTSHPEFGIGGAVLQFGYARSNSYSFPSSISHAIDNWSMTLDVTPIPEPASAALGLGSLALGLVLWRRRCAG